MPTSAIVSAFRSAAARYPEKPALISGDQTVTYRELELQAAAAAKAIAARVSGETVALLVPNSLGFAPVFLGALWAGKTVTVLPTLAPPPILKLMVSSARAETVITTEDFVPRLVEAGIPCWPYEQAESVNAADVPVADRTRDAAVFLFTSGTTGMPKTVELSERNLLDNAEGCRLATGFDDHQIMLAILPLFHAYGLTVTLLLPLITGSTVVIERFIPRQILQTIERLRITCLVAVPSQYRLLAKDPTPADLSSIWLAIAGAERLPEQVALEFDERFHKTIVQGYGATEISPVVSLNLPEANQYGSVGKPLPNLTVTVRDENDVVLPATETGEVCVEGSSVMLGYHNDPQSTARKIRNGVLHTGDRGFFDADGYLHLVGRADDLVKVSGEKVYPAEVETAIENIAGVEEVAVLAFPDEKHGSRLQAYVQLKPDATASENSLRAACREMLEPCKVPRSFTIVEGLPRTATGKTDKRALAAIAV
ncbi:MAG TPA: AMP-binding protein [Terriglobales bacterium]|nr:AMP-binding protein [Terriglobales bacterium]